MAIGYEFNPSQEQDVRKRLNGAPGLSPQSQTALRVLALKLPNVLGGAPPAPADLLKPRPGAGGGTASDVARSVARTPRPAIPTDSSPVSDEGTSAPPPQLYNPIGTAGEGAQSRPISRGVGPQSTSFSVLGNQASQAGTESSGLATLINDFLANPNVSEPKPSVHYAEEPASGGLSALLSLLNRRQV